MKIFSFKNTVILMMFILVSSCFTGIENTKKITEKDVAKVDQYQGTSSGAETQYNKVSVDSFPAWEKGRRFFVVDKNISRVFTPSVNYDLDTLQLAGKVLRYLGYEESSVLDNEPKVNLIFSDGINEYYYASGKTVEEIKRKKLMLSVPFMVDLALVDEYKRQLVGKEFYIRTSIWYNANGEMIPGRKFINVKIKDVLPGDKVFPLSVSFVSSDGTAANVYMSTKQSSVQNRLFDNLFSEKDIRQNYSSISDETWTNIVNGNVAIDMTKEECRLALGTPNNIQERPTYDGLQEYWFYSDGMYLVFFDGLLKQYRK